MGSAPESHDGRGREGTPRGAGRSVLLGAVAAVVLGVAALLAVPLVQSGPAADDARGGEAALVLEQQRSVPLEPEARRVAETWILTAVNRSDLARAYPLTHDDLRGTMSLAEWTTGDIPVVPYPVTQVPLDSWRVASSREHEALLEVRLVPSDETVPPTTFLVGLVKVGGRWLVNYWSPQSRMPMP